VANFEPSVKQRTALKNEFTISRKSMRYTAALADFLKNLCKSKITFGAGRVHGGRMSGLGRHVWV